MREQLAEQQTETKKQQQEMAALRSEMAKLKASSPTTPAAAATQPSTQKAPGKEGLFAPKASSQHSTALDLKKLGVTQKEVDQFIDHVAKGNQDGAEAMLKQKPQLLLCKGAAKDHAGREFKGVGKESGGITGFQYAVWALDWHMWKMIKPYYDNMPEGPEAQKAQIQSLEDNGLTYRYEHWTWHKKPGNRYGHYTDDYRKETKMVEENSRHYDCNQLAKALSESVELNTAWQKAGWKDYTPEAEKCIFHWQKVVGGEQRLVPAHIANEYCRKDRSFVVGGGPPDFLDKSLPRIFDTDRGNWYSAIYNNGTIGEMFFVGRGARPRAHVNTYWRHYKGMDDRAATRSVSAIRTQQHDELVKEILGTRPRAGRV